MKVKKYSILIILFSFIVIFPQCDPEDEIIPSDKNSNYHVNVYSRTTCSLCAALVSNLEQTDIIFYEYDIDANSERDYEMVQLAYDYDLLINGNQIALPFVALFIDTNDIYCWSNPSVADIQCVMDSLNLGN